MEIDITLSARRPEPIAASPTAVSLVTGDDIRRAGVTTLADAVALADGVHVARFNNGTWSVAARGFAAVAANKMLVMVDGRTVYSPLFTGVFWNALDYELEDVDRIEVVRGPGATLWGRRRDALRGHRRERDVSCLRKVRRAQQSALLDRPSLR
jgi:iron complex outermembrane receptor protein